MGHEEQSCSYRDGHKVAQRRSHLNPIIASAKGVSFDSRYDLSADALTAKGLI